MSSRVTIQTLFLWAKLNLFCSTWSLWLWFSTVVRCSNVSLLSALWGLFYVPTINQLQLFLWSRLWGLRSEQTQKFKAIVFAPSQLCGLPPRQHIFSFESNDLVHTAQCVFLERGNSYMISLFTGQWGIPTSLPSQFCPPSPSWRPAPGFSCPGSQGTPSSSLHPASPPGCPAPLATFCSPSNWSPWHPPIESSADPFLLFPPCSSPLPSSSCPCSPSLRSS